MPRVCSLDIFDTCLTRRVDDPNDVFLLFWDALELRLGDRLSGIRPADLYSARIRADALTRSKASAEEITLEQIWRTMAEIFAIPELAAHWEVELEAERKLLIPIPGMPEHAKRLAAEGSRVIYISDTYFPVWFLKERMAAAGFPVGENSIYASSEQGVRKSSGKLFAKVLEAEKISAADLTHTGDHVKSDGEVPQRMGIKAVVIDTDPKQAAPPVFARGCESLPRLAPSLLTKQERLAGDGEASMLVSRLIGPVMVAFVSWVLAKAKRQGVKRLYFMARDGRLAWIVAQALSKSFGEIDCRYLHISRQAVFLPSATGISAEGMPWLQRSFERPVVGGLLAKLEIPREKFTALPPEAELDSPEKWDLFWKTLRGEPVAGFLEQKISERRSAANAYFREAGLFDGVPFGVVDLGWHGNCQRSLNLVLRQQDAGIRSSGFYLGLEIERVVLGEMGTMDGLFNRTNLVEGKTDEDILFHHTVLWEHVFGIADHPWVRGYIQTPEGPKPEYRDAAISPYQAALFSKIEPALRSYVGSLAELAPVLGDEEIARGVIVHALEKNYRSPLPGMLGLLSGINATLDQGSTEAVGLVQPVTTSEALALAAPPRVRSMLGLRLPERLWMKASIVRSGAFSRMIATAGGLLNHVRNQKK